ncbi:prolyl oligopeptidase family serine peptidase [Pontibacter actiniarum]|uniref:Phospholipase n=1 Tax=Pontibacter actiniarum TaxID=323450 RepID=A0A1X9YUZ2_9BACT|nr:prolyl oligopeptidase family serine peptidase [Pontibacter actiniarum]ARS36727.1 phospholipase [Pontibacter actiniarum]
MNSYKYGIYLPESYNPAADKDWPLILFLHGAGEKGNNLELLKRQGLPKYLSARKDFPFVVAYPQCPRQAHWHPSLLNEWLEEVLTKVKADKTRLYLTGISMGGYGTWHWAAANPEKFAAILPICGGGEVNKAARLVHMPVWAFHGAKDDIVPLSETTDMVTAVRALGGNPKLTVYPDLRHDSWTVTYNNPAIYDWLLQHKRNGNEHT